MELDSNTRLPDLSTRQLQNKVQQAGFERSSGILKKILDKFAEECPGADFVLKLMDVRSIKG